MKRWMIFILLILPVIGEAQTAWTPKRGDGTALVLLVGRDGTADITAFGFLGDTNTGIYRLGVDSLAIAVAGQPVAKFGAGGCPLVLQAGNVGFGTSRPMAVNGYGVTNLVVEIDASSFSGNAQAILTLNSGTNGNSSSIIELNRGGAARGLLAVERSSAPEGLLTGSQANAVLLSSIGSRPLQLGTNGTIRATLTSSGVLVLGDTTAYAVKLDIETTAANSSAPLVYFHSNPSSGTDNKNVLQVYQDYASSTGQAMLVRTDAVAANPLGLWGAWASSAAGINGGNSNINDDAVLTISNGTAHGIWLLHFINNSGGGVAAYAVVGTANSSCVILAQGGGITCDASTSDLTAGSGTDGRITVSSHDSSVEISNRAGYQVGLIVLSTNYGN